MYFRNNKKEQKNASWIMCPVCSGKTRVKVREDTVLVKFPLFCPKCGKETLINVRNNSIKIIKEPDAKDAEPMSKE